jgi:hypothetical protein
MKNFPPFFLLVAVGSGGCVQPAGVTHPELAANGRVCEVPALQSATAIRAVEGGVVFSVRAADDSVRVRRTVGEGCDLRDAGGATIAAGALLDADDLGNVYAFPAPATDPAEISTMLPDEYPKSMVARIDGSGRVSKLLPAGRGIWGFGVTARGDALWVSACGPNGLYDVAQDGAHLSEWKLPDTLWEQYASALTDRDTFWSVGVRTCGPSDPLTPACGFALTRSTREGSQEVGSTVVDFGEGFVQTSLVRCGGRVCGVAPTGLVVWDSKGALVSTRRLADIEARPSELIADVTANDDGVYVLLRSSESSRALFFPED